MVITWNKFLFVRWIKFCFLSLVFCFLLSNTMFLLLLKTCLQPFRPMLESMKIWTWVLFQCNIYFMHTLINICSWIIAVTLCYLTALSYPCMFIWTQHQSYRSWETDAKQADAEKVFRRRENETLPEVGRCTEFQAQETAAGQPLVEWHKWYEPRNGERCHCCEARDVHRTGACPQGNVWAEFHTPESKA